MSMNDPEPTQDTTMQDEQQQHYQPQMAAASEDQRYHPDFRDEGRRQPDTREDDIDRQYHNAIANHDQMREPAPPMNTNHENHTDNPLPPAAISQLQAAAAQADELGPPASMQSHPEAQYVPASEYPRDQAMVEDSRIGACKSSGPSYVVSRY